MRKPALRLAWVLVVGAALLLGAAPIPLSAARPQAKGSSAEKKSALPAKKPAIRRSKKRIRRPRAQKAPTPERIREIQGALAQAGFYQGDPTGKWDAASIQAMKKFQMAHSLNPTGKFDALTLQKLGLGSQFAGAAAPRPLAGTARSPQSPPR